MWNHRQEYKKQKGMNYMKMLDIMNGIFLPLLLIPRISLRRKPTSFNILEIGFIISNEKYMVEHLTLFNFYIQRKNVFKWLSFGKVYVFFSCHKSRSNYKTKQTMWTV